jgi:hypothetical protein
MDSKKRGVGIAGGLALGLLVGCSAPVGGAGSATTEPSKDDLKKEAVKSTVPADTTEVYLGATNTDVACSLLAGQEGYATYRTTYPSATYFLAVNGLYYPGFDCYGQVYTPPSGGGGGTGRQGYCLWMPDRPIAMPYTDSDFNACIERIQAAFPDADCAVGPYRNAFPALRCFTSASAADLQEFNCVASVHAGDDSFCTPPKN